MEESQMPLKHAENLKLESPTLEIHKGTSLKTINRLKGTPFDIVEIENKGWMIAFGTHRLTEWRETAQLAIAELEANKWDITISIMEVVINEIMKIGIKPSDKVEISTEGA